MSQESVEEGLNQELQHMTDAELEEHAMKAEREGTSKTAAKGYRKEIERRRQAENEKAA